MTDLSTLALKNKTLIVTILIVLTIGGLLSYMKMSKLEDPELKVRVAAIAAVYPGASASQVELEVTNTIEKAIRSMADVGTVESSSLNDLAIIKVELKTTLPDAEIEQTWDMLRRRVSDAAVSLPPGVSVRVMDDYGDVYGMFYSMTTEGYSDHDVSGYVDMVERELLLIEGVSRVNTYGERKECLNIDISHGKMGNLGIHPTEILMTLNGQNSRNYAGYYESGDSRLRIEVGGFFNSVEDVENLIIQGHEDDQVRLKDVAAVSVGYEQPVRNAMTFDGKKAVGILISAESGTDVTKVGRDVQKRIEELEREVLPAGIEFDHVFFQPDIVRESMRTFIVNLIESVLIVIFILMLTMGFKSGMIIGTSLVIIVFGSFLVLSLFDGTLQRVSLGTFILAMGMLVDNAIVIIDGILVDMKRGVPRREALTSIGRKTAMPLLGATVIAILAFFPIILSPDMAGTYVRDLFIVLAVSLMLSWVLALTHVPIHADYSLHPKMKKEKEGDLFDTKPYRLLRNILRFILRHKAATIAVAAVLVLASVWCFRYVPMMFFPDMSYDQYYVEYKLPENARSEKTMEDLEKMEKIIREDRNVLHVTRSVGGSPGRYCLVRAIPDPSMSYGELIVQCNDTEEMVRKLPELQQRLREAFPDGYLRVKQYNLMYRPFPIEACFSGDNPEVLRSLAEEAEAIMEESDATYMVTNNWSDRGVTLAVNYDQKDARAASISRSDAALSLLAVNGGLPCGTFMQGEERLTIYLNAKEEDGTAIETMRNAPIWGMIPNIRAVAQKDNLQGLVMGYIDPEDMVSQALSPTPLSQISEGVSIRWDEQIICRRNGERAIKVQCNNAQGYTAASARDAVKEKIEKIDLPEGYRLTWLGEYDASRQSTQYLFKNVPLAIVLMFLIMIALFKDLKTPFIIILSLPLIAVGVVFGILVSGKTFGFVAIIGALGIIGMMIKNGIVLIDEINRQISEGTDPYKALLDSSLSRFRPVMMASFTTVLGMIPLLSDPLFGSLAVTIMSGLTVGTLITLLFLPALYAIFFRIKKFNREMKKSCRTIFVILSGLWACMPASGQERSYRYSLEECRAMALDSSKHIYGAELLKEKARYEKNAMLKNFFPKISVSGAYLYNNNDFNITTDPKTFTLPIFDFSVTLPGFTIPIDLTHSYTAGIDIVQPIYMGGKIIAGYKMTRLAGEMAEENRDLKNMEVILAVDEAYWTFVKTCKMYEAAVSFSETVDEVTKVVNDAVEVGFATENDRMKVKIEQNNARVLLSKAANGVKLSRMNLCHHIGIPLLTPIEVDTSGFSLNDDLTSDSASIAERPDYRLLEGKVRLKEENVKVIRADYLPQVGIMARYGYTDALSLFDTRIIEGFGLSVMATIKIPICSWGAGMDKINSAKKDAQIERNEADILQEKMELERQMHHFNALDAKLKVEMCRSIREDAEALFRVSKDRYEVGTGSLASLLEAQTQWMKAKSDYIEAIAEYKLEYTKYLKAIGRLARQD